MKDESKLKKWTTAKFKKEFWKVFTAYIKVRDNNTCFTCGKQVEGGDSHGGHFIPKAAGGLALYFNEDNVHCQCAGCNLFLQGNQYVYGEKLGKEKVKELYQLKNVIVKYSKRDYLQMIEDYKQKIKEL